MAFNPGDSTTKSWYSGKATDLWDSNRVCNEASNGAGNVTGNRVGGASRLDIITEWI